MDTTIRPITDDELKALMSTHPEYFVEVIENEHPEAVDYWSHIHGLLYDAPGG